MQQTCLSTRALSVGYAGRAVVENIELSAVPGEILSVIGPNGAGKTTLIRTLIRQLEPVSGCVLLDGRELSRLPDAQIARSLAAVLTGRPEPELMRCEEVVALGRYPYTGRLGILSAEDRKKVAETMELVGVSELAAADFEQISDGQRQRVLLARALCQEPRVLILDEPVSYLDLKHKLDFLQLLRRLTREHGLAVIMSIHELSLASRFSDAVLCLRDGRVDRSGSPEEIFSRDYIERLFSLDPGSADIFL